MLALPFSDQVNAIDYGPAWDRTACKARHGREGELEGSAPRVGLYNPYRTTRRTALFMQTLHRSLPAHCYAPPSTRRRGAALPPLTARKRQPAQRGRQARRAPPPTGPVPMRMVPVPAHRVAPKAARAAPLRPVLRVPLVDPLPRRHRSAACRLALPLPLPLPLPVHELRRRDQALLRPRRLHAIDTPLEPSGKRARLAKRRVKVALDLALHREPLRAEAEGIGRGRLEVHEKVGERKGAKALKRAKRWLSRDQ